jgi:hypothetical protein
MFYYFLLQKIALPEVLFVKPIFIMQNLLLQPKSQWIHCHKNSKIWR